MTITAEPTTSPFDSPFPMDRHGHTPRDWQAFTDAGIDPAAREPREREVPCRQSGRIPHGTANLSGCCDLHYEAPAETRQAPTFGIDMSGATAAVRNDRRHDTLKPGPVAW